MKKRKAQGTDVVKLEVGEVSGDVLLRLRVAQVCCVLGARQRLRGHENVFALDTAGDDGVDGLIGRGATRGRVPSASQRPFTEF